jgi:hypothetical protein
MLCLAQSYSDTSDDPEIEAAQDQGPTGGMHRTIEYPGTSPPPEGQNGGVAKAKSTPSAKDHLRRVHTQTDLEARRQMRLQRARQVVN